MDVGFFHMLFNAFIETIIQGFFLVCKNGELHCFECLSKPCIPEINLTWVIMYYPFYCIVGFELLKFCKEFYSYIHQVYWSLVFFFCNAFDFGLRVILASQNELAYILFFFNFLEELVWNWYYFFLISLVEFTSEVIWA